MKERRLRYAYTGGGLALGSAIGLLLWTMNGEIVYLWLGVVLGLIIGVAGDEAATDRR